MFGYGPVSVFNEATLNYTIGTLQSLNSVYKSILESNVMSSVWQLKLGPDWTRQTDNNPKQQIYSKMIGIIRKY